MDRSRRTGFPAWGLALLGILGAGPLAPAPAQEVKGLVLDRQTRKPVPQAYIGLLDTNREIVKAVLSHDDGNFTLAAPGPGSYYLYVSQVGYKGQFDGLYELGRGGLLEVEVWLPPLPFELAPVTVTGERRVDALAVVGFYERKERGIGTFIERDELERRGSVRISDALYGINGVQVPEPRPRFGSPEGLLNPEVYIRRGANVCRPAFYVDGAMVSDGNEPVRPDDYMTTTDIEAIEVYVGQLAVPLEFNNGGACGTVLIWSRHAERRR